MLLRSLSASGRFILLLAFAFAFLLLAIQRDLNIYDEGSILVGAMRIANGDVPHRDFFTLYGPAQFYVLASLFKLFSPSVLVERLWDTLVRALIATIVFLIVEKCGARREACFAYVAALIWLGFFSFYGFPLFPALLFALISALLLLHVFEGEPRALMLLTGGAGVGFIALFRYDLGFVTLVAEGLVMVAYVLTQKKTLREKLVLLAHILLPYIFGFAVVLLPVAVGYLAYAPRAVFDIVSYSSEYYARMRSLPFPTWHVLVASPDQIAIYLPIGVWAATLFILLDRKASRSLDPLEHTNINGARWMTILFGVLSIFFYLKGLVRVSVIHMAASIIPALALLAMVVKWGPNGNRASTVVVWLSIFIAAVPTWIAARGVGGQISRNIDLITHSSIWSALPTEEQAKLGSCRAPSGLERIACFKLDKNRIDAARFLQDQTNENDVVFSGLTRHDKTFANDMILYFVAKRHPATKWDLFAPGLQTRADIQTEMVSELESKKPRIAVLESDFDNIAEPNESAVSSGVTILDEYIRNHYDFVANFGSVNVLKRRAT